MCAKIFPALFVVFCAVVLGESKRHSPLISDDREAKNKAAECTFGKQVKEIGSSWFADLGPPFGVMYCIKCDCIRVQRKRRIVARVQCRNIKNECPKPSCEDPVLMPGRCCKSCPGDFFSPDIAQEAPAQTIFEEEEKSTKHFASLLTGRSSLIVKRDDHLLVPIGQNKNNVVATGRFTFHRKNLYYSFYISDKAARPKSVQFVDHTGNILEEHILSGAGGIPSLYQNVTRKVCGVWKRLPREYRRYLKDEQLFAVLVWGSKDQAEFTLSGQIMRYVALGTELFSSLLEPAPGSDSEKMLGAGATAIVSISSSSAPSIHIAVVFNGVFGEGEVEDVPVNISLRLESTQLVIIEEVKRIKKPSSQLNTIEISSPVSSSDLRHLTRGRLMLSISSISHPLSLRLNGPVTTRATCELFQSTLSPITLDKDNSLDAPAGLAWLYLNSEGSLVYNIYVEGLKEKSPIVTLVDISGKRKTELEDLTPQYENGWANGTLDRLGPRVLEPLYSGNLAVNIAIPNNPNSIRGRLSSRPVADARDSSVPVLMKRQSTSLPSNVVGIGWISIDHDCHIHYDISLNGMGNFGREQQLFLEVQPMIAPGAPVTIKLLEDFRGNQIEDTGNELLPQEDLIMLDSGAAFFEIKERHSQAFLFRGRIMQAKVPPHCMSPTLDNDVPISILDRPQVDGEAPSSQSCYHEGRFFKEGDDFVTDLDPCTMCYCQNGRVKCDTMTCPVSCIGGTERVKSATECCAPCLNATTAQQETTNSTRGCKLGKQFHSSSTKIYPFLIPIGFDKCIECVCDPLTLESKCSRTCPDPKTVSDNETYLGDTSVVFAPENMRPAEEIIREGGCRTGTGEVVENNKEFNPRIISIGEYKCVKCKCKKGNITCERIKCSKTQCLALQRQRRNSNEGVKPNEKCCLCKRYRRHQAHRSHHQS